MNTFGKMQMRLARPYAEKASSLRRRTQEGRYRPLLPRPLGDKYGTGSTLWWTREGRCRRGVRLTLKRCAVSRRGLRQRAANSDEPQPLAESASRSSDSVESDTPDVSPTANGNTSATANAAAQVTWESLIPVKTRTFFRTSAAAQYLRDCFALLRRNLWTLMSLTALNSAARFFLVWTLYKAVCAVAVQFFGIPPESIPQEMIPTSGSSGDPNVYQQLSDITFLVFKPLDYLLKGVFVVAALLVCWDTRQDPDRFKIIKEMWSGVVCSFTSAWGSLRRSPGYILLYVILNVMTTFYQGLCLLIIPFTYAIKKLMNIQLALSGALGKKWRDALNESAIQVEPVRRHLYLPYLLLFLTPKLLGGMRVLVVRYFPDRLFVDVPEITWGLIAITTVVAFLMDRMAEIFPIVVYSSTQAETKKLQN